MAITLTFPTGGALVTRGTGRLGEGIVRQFARAGVPQAFTFLSNEAAAKALEAEEDKSVKSALDRGVEEYGRLHTVAVGSGVPVTFASMADLPVEIIEKFMAGDAIGYSRRFEAAIALMRGSGGCSIFACTSVATKRVLEYDGISPFSKGSVDALVRQLAYEESENNIRVKGIVIGWIDRMTIDQVRNFLPERSEKAEAQMDYLREIFDQLESLVRIKRFGTLEDGGNLRVPCVRAGSFPDQPNYRIRWGRYSSRTGYAWVFAAVIHVDPASWTRPFPRPTNVGETG